MDSDVKKNNIIINLRFYSKTCKHDLEDVLRGGKQYVSKISHYSKFMDIR